MTDIPGGPSCDNRHGRRAPCLFTANVLRVCFTVTALLTCLPSSIHADDDPLLDFPNDRLSHQDERMVDDLTRRDMPELVEELLADRETMHHIHIARAYARAAEKTKDATIRGRMLDQAVQVYRRVIALRENAAWLRGERRRFHVAQWEVELATLLLQRQAAPDLDRYEITSGLDYDHQRLAAVLQEAYELYSDADVRLTRLVDGLEENEEPYLLLGIARDIRKAYGQCRVSLSWTRLYLGIISPADGAKRTQHLTTALSTFDTDSRTTRDENTKYNALIGAGIALRGLARYPEATAAFDRVLYSTAPPPLAARARYEKARTLLLSQDYDGARRQLDELQARARRKPEAEANGGAFYIRLSPVIRAYTYLCEAQQPDIGKTKRDMLEERALAAFSEISKEGGLWADVARVYLASASIKEEDYGALMPNELRLTAESLMAQKKYAEAIEAYNSLLERVDNKQLQREARFNIGVCHFLASDYPAAAEAFETAAKTGAKDELRIQALGHAYRCRRQIARASRSPQDYQRLADAADALYEAASALPLAQEAAWIGALARQEAGEYRDAIPAYQRIPNDSPHIWDARRNIARCKQAIFEAIPSTASVQRRYHAARDASDAWQTLATDLTIASSNVNGNGAMPPPETAAQQSLPTDVTARIAEAKLAAAKILARSDVQAYAECLALLGDQPATPQVLGLRIRCHRAMGDADAANQVLHTFIEHATSDEAGTVLMALAAETETQVEYLKRNHRQVEATRVAGEAIPTFEHLLDWISARPQHKQHISVVRFSLVRMLILAEKHEEAAEQLKTLMREAPNNGAYIRTSAILYEQMAKAIHSPTAQTKALDAAEGYWAKLLSDTTLRETAPAEYWQARYHWLKHQLRHGHISDVIKGVETERAWYPDLGGSEWRPRFLALADEARAMREAQTP